jgi:hypothetical protein
MPVRWSVVDGTRACLEPDVRTGLEHRDQTLVPEQPGAGASPCARGDASLRSARPSHWCRRQSWYSQAALRQLIRLARRCAGSPGAVHVVEEQARDHRGADRVDVALVPPLSRRRREPGRATGTSMSLGSARHT